jgi:hypothetical protein
MSAATPAGWYPDPRGEAELRYWDGNEWTEHVHTSGAAAPQASAPPAQAPAPQPQAQQAPPPQAAPQQQYVPGPQPGYAGPPAKAAPTGRRPLPILLGVIIALLVIGGGVFAFLALTGEKDEDKITDAAETALTKKGDEACGAASQEFLERSTDQRGSAAELACENALTGGFATDAEISDAKADGESGDAKAKVTGGNFSGQTLTLEMTKDGDDWKVDGIRGREGELAITGAPTPAAAKEDVEQVVLDFGSSVGTDACDFLSERGLDELGGRSGCESQFDEAVAAVYTVESTEIRGPNATVVVSDDDGDRIEFKVSFERGEWKIDDFEGQ